MPEQKHGAHVEECLQKHCVIVLIDDHASNPKLADTCQSAELR